MKVGVCAKVTPDTDARIKPTGDRSGIDESGIKFILSPYDAFAVEEAVQTVEKQGGETVLFSVGDDSWVSQLRANGLAVGANRAVLVQDPALKGTDSLGVARALAKAIETEGIELVFTGKQAIDDDNSQVPAMVAELLGWPHVSMVTDFEVEGDGFRATRSMGGGVKQVVRGKLPVVITAERGMNSPRYAKLPEIMKAKKKPVDTKDLAALGLSADDVAPAVHLSSFGPPPERPKGRVLQGEREQVVKELVRLLREEAKVI